MIVCVCACARVSVCVCVNPSSTGNGSLHVVMQIGRGTELSDATLSNEAMHQRGKHPLATDVYLPKIV